MKIEDQVVSLTLAKKLGELGVKVESCFTWVEDTSIPLQTLNTTEYIGIEDSLWVGAEIYPAYTVAELGEMLPDAIRYKGKAMYLAIEKSGPDWYVKYESACIDGLPLNAGFTESESEADARAPMLIWLIKNKHVDVEEVTK